MTKGAGLENEDRLMPDSSRLRESPVARLGEWRPCRCGSPTCEREYPSGLGMFYTGSGFSPEEKELIVRAFEALEQQERSL